MKYLFLFLFVFMQKAMNGQKKTKPVLVLSTGYNDGFKTDFRNNSNISVSNKQSFYFDLGTRVYHPKKNNFFFELSVGLGSTFPSVYAGKLYFPSGDQNMERMLFQPNYEFLNAKLFISKNTTLYDKKNLKIGLITGLGLKYFLKLYQFESTITNRTSTEFISYREIFDSKMNSNNSRSNANRPLIFGLNIGLNIVPVIFKKRLLGFELFYSPSFNTGIFSSYRLTTSVQTFVGTNQYKFSNYGLKLLITIPKINLKP